jgi:flagellar hook-associated protein 1
LVLQNLQDQRGSISGVSLDEEAANMVQYQRAYEAAARMVTTVDQMLQTIIHMGANG